jgi:hypothetical protein
MSAAGSRPHVAHIKIGFSRVVSDGNYVDCHGALEPFGEAWGRGILVRGNEYLDAIIGTFGTSHALLKQKLGPGETARGAFYYGFDGATRTLYLEFASDRTFAFEGDGVLDAIMDALRKQNGPLHDFVLTPGAR